MHSRSYLKIKLFNENDKILKKQTISISHIKLSMVNYRTLQLCKVTFLIVVIVYITLQGKTVLVPQKLWILASYSARKANYVHSALI